MGNRTSFKPTHGMSKSPEFIAWQQMKVRCLHPGHRAYRHYGGRGITVCARWLESFENFYADMGPRPKGPPRYTLDRIENNGNYEPANCRWATHREQERNRSNNLLLTMNGETLCATAWAERTGIPRGSIVKRIKSLGWTHQRALTTPPRAQCRP